MAKRRGFDVGGSGEESGQLVLWKEMQAWSKRDKATERFFTNGRHPGVWAVQALELRWAAEALKELDLKSRVNGFGRVAVMLAGMSLEASLKTVRICSLKWPIDEATFRGVARGSHLLDELAVQAGVRANPGDRATLRRLSHCIRWSGRYPLPKTLEELKSFVLDGGEEEEDELWEAYLRVRVKIGKALSRALMRWAKKGRRAGPKR